MAILVTGGAGYIGSHACVELLEAGYEVVVVDNFYNSKPVVLERIREITGKDFKFYEEDCCNEVAMDRIFDENKIDAVIHFAGYKAVGESVLQPIKYYENNIGSTIALIKSMQRHECFKIAFSSSATVYGVPEYSPVPETFPLSAVNPYGTTKLYIEHILGDVYTSDPRWSIALLRYFNPIGAHKSGLIGENPNDIPNNLMPYITKVAAKELPILHVFGNDYNTKDGTGVRDYIHVVDLAKGHIAALRKILETTGIEAYNLGTGKGYSVLEIVENFKRVNNIDVPYQIDPRRPGDIDEYFADPTKAKVELGFECELGIEEMCRDSWHFIEEEKKREL
ncbi:MAG: UDP-glucose 4-epimerase GalE [Erysipelotrichaceae bacterium]|nr:UDP-glucose 4-epimerase GalE [Erysipelotrichaceae bacterium]